MGEGAAGIKCVASGDFDEGAGLSVALPASAFSFSISNVMSSSAAIKAQHGRYAGKGKRVRTDAIFQPLVSCLWAFVRRYRGFHDFRRGFCEVRKCMIHVFGERSNLHQRCNLGAGVGRCQERRVVLRVHANERR